MSLYRGLAKGPLFVPLRGINPVVWSPKIRSLLFGLTWPASTFVKDVTTGIMLRNLSLHRC
jgi:hypothetical protein